MAALKRESRNGFRWWVALSTSFALLSFRCSVYPQAWFTSRPVAARSLASPPCTAALEAGP